MEWTQQLPGYRTKTIQSGSITVRIHRPELTPEEQKKKEDAILRALARCGLNERKEEQHGEPYHI